MEHNIQQSLFFDIETTGLSADISAITVIGCCDMDGNVTQWFNEDGLSQKQILTDFLAFIQPYNTLITFNGKTFDLPFLTSKIKEFKINASFDQYEHLDLYQILKPYKNLWGLKNFRQKNLEEYLGIQRIDKLSGKKLIKTYQDYLENGEIKNKESLLLHNHKDLIGLHKIYSLMSYPALLDKEFTLSSYFIENDHFVAHLNLDIQIPVSCNYEKSGISLTLDHSNAILTCPLENGHLKHYLKDYKNYYTVLYVYFQEYFHKSMPLGARFFCPLQSFRFFRKKLRGSFIFSFFLRALFVSCNSAGGNSIGISSPTISSSLTARYTFLYSRSTPCCMSVICGTGYPLRIPLFFPTL